MKDDYHVLNVAYNGALLFLFQTLFWWWSFPHNYGEAMYIALAVSGAIFQLYIAVEMTQLMLLQGGRIASWPVLAAIGVTVNYVFSALANRFYLFLMS